jgi:hypothetical protein
MARGGRAREMSERRGRNHAVRAFKDQRWRLELGVPMKMMLQPSNRRVKPGNSVNCSPYLELADKPHRCVARLLHNSTTGENLPNCFAKFSASCSMFLLGAWALGLPNRLRADVVFAVGPAAPLFSPLSHPD